MEKNNITSAIVRLAVEDGIKNIKEDSHRGIRNLVELGGMFSNGRFQREFFDLAYKELQDENSTYYKLTEKIIEETNTDTLTNFGFNLGYNSWTKGAKIIRDIEEKEKFNIPWCIQFDFRNKIDLSSEMILDIIKQGKNLGIYTYILYLDKNNANFSNLLKILPMEKSCAFILFFQENLLEDKDIEYLSMINNVMLIIDMDTKDKKNIERKIDFLKKKQCLIGGFSRYNNLDKEIDLYLKKTHELELSFLFLFGIETNGKYLKDLHDRKLLILNDNLNIPVFPIDFYPDIANIDRNISTEECLTIILGDGTVVTTDINQERINTGYSVKEESLQFIFSKTMPKGIGD